MKQLPFILFWALGIIWGSNFIYMKLAAAHITPLQIVFWRVAFGFIPVAIYAYFKGTLQLSHAKHIGHFLVMAVIATIAYYYGFAKGTSLLFSGVAGALSGSIPLFSFILAMLFLVEEKASTYKIIGIITGFIGVLLIARPFGADLASTNIEGVAYMVMGSLSVGASFVYAKKFILPLKIASPALTTYQLGLSLILLMLITEFDGIGNVWQDTHAAAGLIIGLGILGTGLAYIIYYYIIEKLGAVTAASVTYIPPIVALAIGAVLVGEAISLWDYLGTAAIFLGVILINKKR